MMAAAGNVTVNVGTSNALAVAIQQAATGQGGNIQQPSPSALPTMPPSQ